MENLHDLFDRIGIDQVKYLLRAEPEEVAAEVAAASHENLAGFHVAMVYTAYAVEKDLMIADVAFSPEELKKLVEAFMISAALYVNIADGNLEITGRMWLTRDNHAAITMTEKGRRHVENNLLSPTKH